MSEKTTEIQWENIREAMEEGALDRLEGIFQFLEEHIEKGYTVKIFKEWCCDPGGHGIETVDKIENETQLEELKHKVISETKEMIRIQNDSL